MPKMPENSGSVVLAVFFAAHRSLHGIGIITTFHARCSLKRLKKIETLKLNSLHPRNGCSPQKNDGSTVVSIRYAVNDISLLEIIHRNG